MERPKRLSAAFVRSVEVPGRYGDGWGGHGLSLLVKTRRGGGLAKSWAQRVRINGKATNVGLGAYPVVTLAEARDAALANRREIAQGRDPRTTHIAMSGRAGLTDAGLTDAGLTERAASLGFTNGHRPPRRTPPQNPYGHRRQDRREPLAACQGHRQPRALDKPAKPHGEGVRRVGRNSQATLARSRLAVALAIRGRDTPAPMQPVRWRAVRAGKDENL